MDPPLGYPAPEGHVLKLEKAPYSLKQAGRQWYQKLKATLKEFTLEQVVNNPHTFICHKTIKGGRKTIIIPIYVDDLTVISDKILTDNF